MMSSGKKRIFTLGLVGLCIGLVPVSSMAESDGRERNEQVVANLPRAELQSIRRLSVVSGGVLDRMGEQMAPEALEAEAVRLAELGPIGIGTREVDGDGRAAIHRELLERIDGLSDAGVELLGSYRGQATVSVKAEGKDPVVEVAGERIALHTVHPNGPMPSLVPESGLEGPLVDVQLGDWEDLRGLELEGAICLMDFRGGRNWERLFSLGARAVIVVEDSFVKRAFAEELFAATPVPFARFYADAETGERLRELAAAGESGRLVGGDIYERRPYESIFAYLPPGKPVKEKVSTRALLEFVAVEAGISLDELLTINPEMPEVVEAGDELILPGGETYRVRPNDLLKRLSDLYGVSTDKILESNGLEGGSAPAGAELDIPNLEQPMVLLTRIDSVSSVPHSRHGGTTIANLAIALRMMDYLSHESSMVRRRGVVFGFIDGDLQGGLTTRGLTEYFLRAEGAFAGEYFEGEEERVRKYRQVMDWLESEAALSDEAGQWFVEDWLATVVEKVRVTTAEERVEIIKDQQATDDEGEQERLQESIDQKQAMIDAIAALRDETILNGGLGFEERAESFLDHALVNGGAVAGLDFPIEKDGLLERFRTEQLQLERNVTNNASNREVVEELRRVMGSERNLAPGYYFDFSDGSETISLKVNVGGEHFRNTLPFKVDFTDNLANRLRDVSNVAAVTAGWPESFNFFSMKDNLDFAVQSYEAVPYYPRFWQSVGVSLLPLGTLNDSMQRLDTPHDTVDRLDFGNLSVQSRTALVVIGTGLESALDSAVPSRQGGLSGEVRSYGLLTGRTVQFNIRSGIDAQEPVAGTTLFYPAVPKSTGSAAGEAAINTFAFRGARMGILQTTFLDGSFTLPLESVNYATAVTTPKVFGFYLDREQAVHTKVVNQGIVGTQKRTADFSLLPGDLAQKDLVMTDVYPRVFFPGSDPMNYTTVGAEATENLSVTDAVLSGEPQYYGLVNAFQDYREEGIDSLILFMREGRRARVAAQVGAGYKMILPGEITEEEPKGRGFLVGPVGDDRNLSMPFTPVEVARSMLALSERRQQLYEQFGIRDQTVNAALERSRDKLAEAEASLEEQHWQAALGFARESWGMLVKQYPDLLALGRQAVFSVILLMALLVPGVVFLERLTIGAKTIMGHLAGALGFFAVATIFLRLFHPAFKVSVSPFIVIISFAMILMSVVVLALSYQRFEVLLRRARASGGEVEGEEATLMSSMGTALSLGISNLKKRPSRTFLTSLTVTVLTFSIVAFVSVSGTASVDRKELDLDRDIGGQMVEPYAPKYEGILFREYNWQALPGNFISALQTEFGTHYELTRRGYYIEAEGGNNADREGVNQVSLQYGGQTSIVTGIMTFEPNETKFSQLHRAVSGQQWFRPIGAEAEKRLQIILPDTAAADLGIGEEDLLDESGSLRPMEDLPEVRMQNHIWKVIGILDTEEADRYRDITGESLAMVDYLRSAFSGNMGGELINEPDGFHKSWKEFVAIPRSASQDVDAKPRSVAIRLPEGADHQEFYDDIAMRLNRTFFGYLDGEMALVTTKKQLSLGGLAKIIVPIILCILIVTNTMLGAVEERRGEVGMLGAIGLSPRQISFLLLSESTVFSVLGVVFGIFGGLAFANLVPVIAANFDGFLGGLSFNFTSMLSMALAMATGLVVLLATLLPAQKAAAMAAPSGMSKWELPEPDDSGEIVFELPFTLTRGNAVGMLAFFRQFLGNHTDATSADFNCRNIAIQLPGEAHELWLGADMWLTPYDLDVAQHFTMRMRQGDNPGVSVVELHLARFSGTEEAWLRTNYGFLDLVRRQFLLWRNMTPENRQQYIEKGRELLDAAAEETLSLQS